MNLNFLSRIAPLVADHQGFSVPAGDEGSVNLRVDGADAQDFLQGQLTIDVNVMQPGQAQIGALCTPQGRVSAVFDVLRMPDHFALILPLSIAGAVAAQLQRYVLRSKVTIGPIPTHGTISARYDALSDLRQGHYTGSEDNFVYSPGWLAAGWRFTNAVADDALQAVDQLCATWTQARILWGASQPVEKTRDLFLPQMLDLDQHDGVSYNKGCYTGQEVIARTHFRGTVKRRLHRLVLSATESRPDVIQLTDTILTVDQSRAGTVVECAIDDAGNQAIMAVVKNAAADSPLYYGDHQLVPWPLR